MEVYEIQCGKNNMNDSEPDHFEKSGVPYSHTSGIG